MFPNTLLGYFKTGLVNNHCSIKYFNRAFLAVYITEYNESKKSGIADYTKTKTTEWRPGHTEGVYTSGGWAKSEIVGTPEKTKKYATLCRISGEINTDEIMREVIAA